MDQRAYLGHRAEGPVNVGSIPKFQVETRRVLVLTATARGDTVLLIVSMNKSHQQDHRQNVSLEEEEGEVQAGTLESSDELQGEEQGQPQQILQAEENYIQGEANGNLVEDNVNIIEVEEAMENIAINEVNMDTENESFSLRISPPNTTESEEADTENDVMNFEEDCSYDATEDDDDEYTYTYEEVTDSDTEDVDES